MRIARFGDTYAGGYVFSTALMADSWQSMRPPIAQAVSGASGFFDYYGTNNYPIAPVVASKKFGITGTSSADLEDSLITLRAATIATDRSKLWWLDRDNSTNYWAWAKCTRLKASDSYKERGRWVKNVDISFYMPEGIWYGASQNSDTFTFSGGTFADESISTSGNLPALPTCTVTPSGANATTILVNIVDLSIAANISVWKFTDTVNDGDDLVVNAADYICTNNAVDAYSGLSIGYDAHNSFDPQIVFMHFSGVASTMNGTLTGANAGSCAVTWWDRYVF